jgi:hypothetical protein
MNTIKALIPYQTETFRIHPAQAPRRETEQQAEAHSAAAPPQGGGKFTRLPRSTPFLVQLMVSGDSDLRKTLGRQEIAQARESAYGASLANRPSANGLRFLTARGEA